MFYMIDKRVHLTYEIEFQISELKLLFVHELTWDFEKISSTTTIFQEI